MMPGSVTVAVVTRDAELRHLRCLVCGELWAKDRGAPMPDVCPQTAKHESRARQKPIPKRPTLSNGPKEDA